MTNLPPDSEAVFIADLHLSAETTPLNDAFVAFIHLLLGLPKLQSLYILGDWLDGWIGDDDYLSLDDEQKKCHWLSPILLALKQLSANVDIVVLQGNRDFALRQSLCDEFGGKLVKEPFFVDNVRLEHGDLLCTDDKSYQRYRKIIRNPVVSWLFLKQPLTKRRALAQQLKAHSHRKKTQKPATIMDANPQAVQKALATCTLLIHGHTHRPAVHDGDKKRVVVGDWQIKKGSVKAMVAVRCSLGVVLCLFCHRFGE